MGAGASVQDVRDLTSEDMARSFHVTSTKSGTDSQQEPDDWADVAQLVEEEDMNGAKIIDICKSSDKIENLRSKLESSKKLNETEKRGLLERIESFRADVLETQAKEGSYFEKRGVSIKLLRAIKAEALKINGDEKFWTIGAVSTCLVGNHELLLDDSNENKRYKNIDPAITLTYVDEVSLGSSLIDVLQRNHQSTPHPRLGCTYQEVVHQATAFVSFAYSSNYFDVVDALETIMSEANNLGEKTTFFWFDLFVNDQWRALSHDFTWWSNTFREAIQDIGHTICIFHPWENPKPLQRVWCLYEIFCSQKLSIALSSREVDSFHEALRNDHKRIMRALTTIDLENAQSYLQGDKDRVFEVVRQGDGFHQFNMLVKDLLRDWFEDVARELVKVHKQKIKNEANEDTTMATPPMQSVNEGGFADMEAAASLLLSHGEFQEAVDIYSEALEGLEKSNGRKHELTLQCRMHLALAFKRLNRQEEAKVHLEEAYIGFEEIRGSDDENTLDALTNLANSIVEMDGDLSVAHAYYNKALEGYEKLQKDHPVSSVIISNIANILETQENYDDALKYYNLALVQKKKTLGQNDPSTLNTLSNYAGLLHDTGQFEESEKMYLEALTGREETLGDDHLDTLKVINNYALLLEDMMNYEKAKTFYEKALKGKTAILGPDHPSVENTRTNLQMCIDAIDEGETDGEFSSSEKGPSVKRRDNHHS